MDWRDIPSLSALRAFEAAARLGSFSAAARELNVTHAAIAQHLRTLEAHFGLRLMERDGRGMAPTAQGRQLAADLSRGFGEIAGGVRALSALRGTGPLSVTTTQTFAENWLIPRLSGFWAAHPDIPLSISVDHAVIDLRRSEHHLGIRYGRGRWPGTDAHYLTAGHSVIVGHPDLTRRLPSEFDPDASVAAMAELPWLLDPDFPEFSSFLATIGLDVASLSTKEFNSNTLILAATRSGVGLSFQTKAVVEADVAAGRLDIVLEQDDPTLGYYVVLPKGGLSDRARVFHRWLKQAIAT